MSQKVASGSGPGAIVAQLPPAPPPLSRTQMVVRMMGTKTSSKASAMLQPFKATAKTETMSSSTRRTTVRKAASQQTAVGRGGARAISSSRATADGPKREQSTSECWNSLDDLFWVSCSLALLFFVRIPSFVSGRTKPSWSANKARGIWEVVAHLTRAFQDLEAISFIGGGSGRSEPAGPKANGHGIQMKNN